ncbi:MAG: hypothetical protein KF734_13745 [Saprospiraceae bacterium]|nr:hypothetical protein [Saprospiraceae bacterium]
MRHFIYSVLFIFALGHLCHFGLPWWGLVPVAMLAGWLFPLSAGKNFSAAFLAGALLWFVNAYLYNAENDGMLATKVGLLFQGLNAWQLLGLTGVLGGVLAGFGAMTGRYARDVFVSNRA